MSDKPDVKELFFEADTRRHQQFVIEKMMLCVKRLIDKATSHDSSKFSDQEKPFYINPVWELNTDYVVYGSEKYKEICKRMGPGFAHHVSHNDHHPEFFESFAVQTLNDPIRAMDLFAILEMLCDWMAAAKRKGNSPLLALDALKKKYHIDEQLEAVMRNTVGIIEELK